jgi:hypothetical protein
MEKNLSLVFTITCLFVSISSFAGNPTVSQTFDGSFYHYYYSDGLGHAVSIVDVDPSDPNSFQLDNWGTFSLGSLQFISDNDGDGLDDIATQYFNQVFGDSLPDETQFQVVQAPFDVSLPILLIIGTIAGFSLTRKRKNGSLVALCLAEDDFIAK